LKRSDAILAPPAPADADPPASSPLRRSAWANLPVPLLLIAVALLGRLVFNADVIGADRMEIVMQVGVAIVLAVSLQLINGFSGQFSLGHAGFMAVGAYLSGYPSVAYGKEMTDPAAVLFFYVALFVTAGLAAAILLALFLAARASGRLHPALPAVLMVLIFAWVLVDIALAPKQGTIPWYFLFSRGIRGLQSVFGTITAGGSAVGGSISDVLPEAARGPVCFVVLLVGGGLCAAAAGLIVGLPTLRLSGDYLAIATLGFAEIIRIAIQNSTALGASNGMGGIPTYTTFPWLYGAGVVLTTVVIWRVAYSDKGRAIQAVREDEVAAAACGVDTTHHKVLSFVIGSFFAGVAGALFAHYTGFLHPTDFTLTRSIEIVVMVTLGGLASISGAILAAIVLTLLPEVLRNVSRELAEWRMVIYSAALIAMMLLRPQGLLGGRELWPRKWGRPRRVAPPVSDPPAPEAAA
jgi:branched-chain amino acid transport system permease protein